MKVLGASLSRRGFGYVLSLTVLVTFAGAAGMYAFENGEPGGPQGYGEALWWTAMVMTTMGSQYWPETVEGRVLCLFLALYAFGVFGYVTAALATFFVGRDADNDDAELAGARPLAELRMKSERCARRSARFRRAHREPDPLPACLNAGGPRVTTRASSFSVPVDQARVSRRPPCLAPPPRCCFGPACACRGAGLPCGRWERDGALRLPPCFGIGASMRTGRLGSKPRTVSMTTSALSIFWMRFSRPPSSGDTSDSASPVWPLRPVRPMRCT